jgi:hypothetical protein
VEELAVLDVVAVVFNLPFMCRNIICDGES